MTYAQPKLASTIDIVDKFNPIKLSRISKIIGFQPPFDLSFSRAKIVKRIITFNNNELKSEFKPFSQRVNPITLHIKASRYGT